MAKEYIYYCKTCGKIENREVLWVTLQQSVDMSFCPYCKVQINRKQFYKDCIPRPETVTLKKPVKLDLFDKYGGRY